MGTLRQEYYEKTYVDIISKSNKEWRKPHKCIYPGCTNYSIKRSHTIQRATSFKSISEKGHLLTPYLKEHPDKIEYSMKLIGINEASTFPGFCNRHERIFESFEKDGRFKTDKDYGLQILRTICKEIVFNKHELVWLKKSYDSYMEQICNLFVKRLEEHYCTDISELGIKSIKIDNDDAYKKLHDSSVAKIEKTLNKIEELFTAYFKNEIAHFNIDVPFQIPVAISGISNTELLNHNRDCVEDGIIVLNCLPFKDSTSVIISCLNCYKNAVLEFLKYRTQTELFFLSFIESFMINGTEHWFIKPSVWNKLNERKKRQILNDIFFSNWNIRVDYKYSIFDDIRRKYIEEWENGIDKSNVHYSKLAHLYIEKQKLFNIPENIEESTDDLVYKAANMELEKLMKNKSNNYGKL